MPFPDYAQRLKFIEHLHAISPDDAPMRESLGDARAREEFARETAGLNLFGIHDIARQAATTQQEARVNCSSTIGRRASRLSVTAF